MKKIIILILTIPILLGISDYLNMYTFTGAADKAFLILGFAVAFVVFVYNIVLTIKAIRKHQKNAIILHVLLEIYSIIYLFIILSTYVEPYIIEFEF